MAGDDRIDDNLQDGDLDELLEGFEAPEGFDADSDDSDSPPEGRRASDRGGETGPMPVPGKSQPAGFGVVDRRTGIDRRDIQPQLKGKGKGGSGLDRRRGPGRRLSDFTKAAEEGEMTKEQFLFLMAIDEFKKANDKAFPTWTDVLEIIRLLGYRKTMPMEIALRNAEDWREAANTASNVRPVRPEDRAEAEARKKKRDAA
ncbi:MAG: hypothetical protein AAGB51_10365 [Planctomycetota bacterium]